MLKHSSGILTFLGVLLEFAAYSENSKNTILYISFLTISSMIHMVFGILIQTCIFLIFVRVHRVLPKDRTHLDTTSNKQITDQHTDVCHVVKTLEMETVHGPSQIATWRNLLCERKKFTNEILINDQLAKDLPCSLNRDHGPIRC